jgi:hypothetical protein
MTDVGLQYSMFSKTEKDSAIGTGTYGHNLATGTAAVNKAKIGDEIDLWAEHRYDGGLSMLARVSMFMPGDVLKDSSFTPKKSDTITQVFVQGRLTF